MKIESEGQGDRNRLIEREKMEGRSIVSERDGLRERERERGWERGWKKKKRGRERYRKK